MAEHDIRSELSGWAPEDQAVHIMAQRDPEFGHWEAVLPEFSIAGQGATLELAITNATELLHDYLLLCKRDGKTFKQSYRGMGPKTAVSSIVDIIKLAISSRRRRERVDTRRPLSLA